MNAPEAPSTVPDAPAAEQRRLAELPSEQLVVVAAQASREARELRRQPASHMSYVEAIHAHQCCQVHVEHMANVIDVLLVKLKPHIEHERYGAALHAAQQRAVDRAGKADHARMGAVNQALKEPYVPGEMTEEQRQKWIKGEWPKTGDAAADVDEEKNSE